MNNQSKQKILKKYWGFDSFRPKQEEIINSVLSKKDTLALLPTGGGKSLCYQIPAIIMEGVCLVISPLIALMEDQISQLQKRKIKAVGLSSKLKTREIDIILDNCIYGNTKLLYLSPERLQSEMVLERIKKMKISFVAVDEAHCISQWGYDFRPSYLKISVLHELKPNISILALTATATKEVSKDIQKELNFKKRNLIKSSFKRDNLAYMVLEENHILDRLKKILDKIKGSAIVYVRSRKKTHELNSELTKMGIHSLIYHAGLPIDQRTQNQKKWSSNKARVMIATNAFGMGIDKPDVRLVIHLHPPDSIESYFQEAGRAGRDGKKSYAINLYQKQELENSLTRFEENYPSPKDVRSIYQKLADYLQISIGDGFEESFNINTQDFITRFKLNKFNFSRALSILEKEEIIEYNFSTNASSKIQFIKPYKTIINYNSSNKDKLKLLQTILRLYHGVFDEPTDIVERDLAISLEESSTNINKMLNQFQKEEILKYKQKLPVGKITFKSARYKTEHLPLSKTHFNERKQILINKIRSMNEYLVNTTCCRSKILLNYFGEIQTNDCGICDVCILNSINENEFKKEIRTELFNELKKNPIDISIFIGKYSKIKEPFIIDTINELLSEQRIKKTGKILKLNEE